MNKNALKGLMVSKGLNVGKIVELLNRDGIKISRATFYRKLSGDAEFDRSEIEGLIKILDMSNDNIISIFFREEVS